MTDHLVDFDHTSAAHGSDPHSIYAELRRECPVARTEAHGGFWVVSRYADVLSVVQDPHVFSSRVPSIPVQEGLPLEIRIPPLTMDPPDHTRAKRLLATWFTPKRVSTMEPVIREVADSLIDDLVGREAADVSECFPRMVPAHVLSAVLEIPRDDMDQFFGWLRQILESIGEAPQDSFAAVGEFLQYVGALVQHRKAEPGEDLISHLLHTDDGGERLSEMEITLASMELLGAGIDTVWSTLTSSLLHLATHPADQERLRRKPELVVTAREEFLRSFCPVAVVREVTTPTQLHGTDLAVGDRLLVSYLSANRDSSEFDRADEVLIDREPAAHLAFGAGIHRCLGSHLARRAHGGAAAVPHSAAQLPPRPRTRHRVVARHALGTTHAPHPLRSGRRVCRLAPPPWSRRCSSTVVS